MSRLPGFEHRLASTLLSVAVVASLAITSCSEAGTAPAPTSTPTPVPTSTPTPVPTNTPTPVPTNTPTPVPTNTPTPVPTNTPTPVPAPTLAPTPTSTPVIASTPVPEEYELRLWVSGQGSVSYALGVGTTEIINKNHPWLRVRAIEQSGPEGMLAYESEPDKRPFTLLSGNQNDIGVYVAGLEPLSGPILPPQVLFNYAPNSSVGLICADPDIEHIRDLAGRKVAMGVPGYHTIYMVIEALAIAEGVWDEIDLQVFSSSIQQRWAYIDGRIDCTYIGIIDQWATSTGAEPMQTRGAYAFDHGDDDLFALARRQSGIPMFPNTLCPGAFRESLSLDYDPVQAKVNYIAYTPGYMAAPQVPEGIIYELMRTVYDHRFEYKDYHRFGVYIEDQMANMIVSQEYFHPGAVRLYEEEGIEYGLAGHLEHRAKAKAAGHGNAACL